MKIHYKLELEFSSKSLTKARARIQDCLDDAILDLDDERDSGAWIDKHNGRPLGAHELEVKKAGPRRR